MALIRATCSDCDVELRSGPAGPSQCRDDESATYLFRCPVCRMIEVRPAEQHVVDVLPAAGVHSTEWHLPAELTQRRGRRTDHPRRRARLPRPCSPPRTGSPPPRSTTAERAGTAVADTPAPTGTAEHHVVTGLGAPGSTRPMIQNFGGGELLVILILALVVPLGPERIPEMAKSAGKMIAKLKTMSSGLQGQVQGVMDDPAMQPCCEFGDLAARPPEARRVMLEAEADERARANAPIDVRPNRGCGRTPTGTVTWLEDASTGDGSGDDTGERRPPDRGRPEGSRTRGRSMALGDHLRELRRRLLICVGTVAAMLIPAWFLYPWMIDVLNAPYRRRRPTSTPTPAASSSRPTCLTRSRFVCASPATGALPGDAGDPVAAVAIHRPGL